MEREAWGAALDARFVYYLLASTGICVVPLSGFCSPHPGFRFTLLETDDAKRRWTLQTLARAITDYLNSQPRSATAGEETVPSSTSSTQIPSGSRK